MNIYVGCDSETTRELANGGGHMYAIKEREDD